MLCLNSTMATELVVRDKERQWNSAQLPGYRLEVTDYESRGYEEVYRLTLVGGPLYSCHFPKPLGGIFEERFDNGWMMRVNDDFGKNGTGDEMLVSLPIEPNGRDEAEVTRRYGEMGSALVQSYMLLLQPKIDEWEAMWIERRAAIIERLMVRLSDRDCIECILLLCRADWCSEAH